MRGARQLLRHQQGFTLIELITVITILGVVGIGITSYIKFGVQIYSDAVGRERQLSDSRFIIERLTRELREALPNSVRVAKNGSSTVQCIEFLPIHGSSSYVDIPLIATSKEITLVKPHISGGDKIAIYPLEPAEVYVDPGQSFGKIFYLTAQPEANPTAVAPYTDTVTIKDDKSVRFSGYSPTSRYFLVGNAVSYCADGLTIKRYDDYWPGAAPQAVPPAVTGVLMAQQQINNTPFKVEDATLLRNAIVQLDFDFQYTDENLQLFHEVHIANVP